MSPCLTDLEFCMNSDKPIQEYQYTDTSHIEIPVTSLSLTHTHTLTLLRTPLAAFDTSK